MFSKFPQGLEINNVGHKKIMGIKLTFERCVYSSKKIGNEESYHSMETIFNSIL